MAVPGAGADPASVDIGSTPALPSGAGDCSAHVLLFQSTTGQVPGYLTTAGVITSWSVMPYPEAAPQQLVLKVGRTAAPLSYTLTGSSSVETLTNGRLNSFLTRIPVVAGDHLGLFLPTPGTCAFSSSVSGDTVNVAAPVMTDPAVGTEITTGGTILSLRLDVSARIEPDGDGDGYGDLTQDACPTLRNSHDDCTPPDTFLKAGPPKRVAAHGRKAKVTMAFFASEAGATFTCALDKAAATPCHSPVKVTAKSGKHQVTITSTDAVGNVDPTPLVVRFKVVAR
jgi:hypothetical protein